MIDDGQVPRCCHGHGHTTILGPASPSPRQVIADELATDVMLAWDDRAGRILAALTAAGYTITAAGEPEDEITRRPGMTTTTPEPDYPVGTVVRAANGWSVYRRIATDGPQVWEILTTGDEHGDRVFKGALRDHDHPRRPLTVIDEPPAGWYPR